MALALLFACSTGQDTGDRWGPAETGTDGGSADGGAADGGSADGGSADGGSADGGSADGGALGPCPDGMVWVEDPLLPAGEVCIDAWEAALEEQVDGAWVAASPYEVVDGRAVRAVPAEGVVPQGYISGDEAEAACAAAGKRLCSSEEWLSACQGPEEWTWPYAASYVDWACNDHYPGSHPVIDYFGTTDGVWDMEHMNDPGINQQPDTVAAGGAYTACRSAWGAFDLHGNLHEWVADADGSFRGGFYADAEINGQGCTYVTTAHGRDYHDYSTGFRCCTEAGG
ncbi:SUMF1/EgtB/PvdO family nonheme iron enzyme [Myxococcota bacterium]|nr:SUMF1/EgtB/PvdO family nonheme iron enzyme [Myxococcota bacterium]